MIVRYFMETKVNVELHEDLHPNPAHEMWVTVRNATTGEHLANVKVGRCWECGVVCGVRVWVGAPCAPQLYARARECAEREVHHDSSVAFLLQELKKTLGVDEWRPYAVDGYSGRKFVRTVINYVPRSADGRRVRQRHG